MRGKGAPDGLEKVSVTPEELQMGDCNVTLLPAACAGGSKATVYVESSPLPVWMLSKDTRALTDIWGYTATVSLRNWMENEGTDVACGVEVL